MEIRDYQRKAIDAAINSFKEHSRATIVMACGTGKTLVALWIAQKMQAQTILVLMPSLLLIKQTIEAWTQQNPWLLYKYMAVCSDTKLLDDDTLDVDVKDCCFNVCTDKEQINLFLKDDTTSTKIIFCTYLSSPLLPKDYGFHLAIFDEAHRIAQEHNENFNYCLSDKRVLIHKRLFLTATPKIYAIRNNKEKSEYSMDNKAKYGPIVYELGFAEAIKHNIICDYRVIISCITDETVNEIIHNTYINVKNKKLDTILIAHLAALRLAMHDYPISKGIVFVKDIADTKKFTESQRITKLLDATVLDVNGSMKHDEHAAVMEEFKNKKRAIISNARCLSEGVDIPQIELVGFMTPKKSKIDIIQALGRVLRKKEGKELGYILLPLYIKKDDNLEEIIEHSDYKFIKNILSAIKHYDTSFVEYSGQHSINIKKRKRSKRAKIEFSDVDTHMHDIVDAIEIQLINSVSEDWYESLEEAKRWKENNGSWIVPYNERKNKKYTKIIRWMCNQRHFINNKELSQEKIDILKSLEFPFDAQEERDKRNYEIIEKYLKEHHKFPTCKDIERSAYNWLYNKRKLILDNKHDIWATRIQSLIESCGINNGIILKSRINIVEQNVEYLEQYYAKHGHIHVRYKDNERVAKWLVTPKQGIALKYKVRLKRIGFTEFNRNKKSRSEEWENKYIEAKEYKQQYGTFTISKSDEQHQELRRWIVRQREKYRNHREFEGNQMARLAAIGLFKKNVDSNKWRK